MLESSIFKSHFKLKLDQDYVESRRSQRTMPTTYMEAWQTYCSGDIEYFFGQGGTNDRRKELERRKRKQRAIKKARGEILLSTNKPMKQLETAT